MNLKKGITIGNLAEVDIEFCDLWQHIFIMKKKNLEDEVKTSIHRKVSKYQLVYLEEQIQF